MTVEIDAQRAAAAQALFAGYPNVQVIQDDWRAVLAYAPFVLLFADGGKAKQHAAEHLLMALQPGGLIVMDDLSADHETFVRQYGGPDPVRTLWLNDERVAATELLVTPTSTLIVAVRRAP